MEELIRSLITSGVLKTASIEEAFRAVDRADFVPEALFAEAYFDTALPIGYGQTISQPYTVAFMLELLGPLSGEKILDVGSGSGWTTALLAHVVGEEGEVTGVEVVPELVEMGQHNLARQSFPHAKIVAAGSDLGFSEKAPFHRILVSAAAAELPQQLVAQLEVGGVLVLPIQEAIWKVTKVSREEVSVERYEGFAFVPLVEPH